MKHLRSLSIILVVIFFESCSEEFIETPDVANDNLVQAINTKDSSENEFKRIVSYKLEGDFSGKLDITFLSSEGFPPPNQIIGAEIPWNIKYHVPDDIQAIGGFANGLYGDANAGETASLKMFLNDNLIETTIRNADSEGLITLPLESYHLEFDKAGTTISDKNIGKEITYRLQGYFSGIINLIYKVADGSSENILINELPWEYSFDTTKDSYQARIYGLGSNGIENEEIEFSLVVDQTIFESKRVGTDTEGRIGLFPELVLEFE